MEFQLLVILAVAFIVFGPEKMLEFAAQLGKLVRRIKQEMAEIQLDMEMEKLREDLKKQTLEGEQKVKALMEDKVTFQQKKPKEFIDEFLQKEGKPNLSMEELFQGKAPVVEDETQPKKENNQQNPKKV
jgi:Sec-independent protein translocase protein TatA